MQGFEQLGLDELLLYISENYKPLDDCGCIDENSTFMRRLEFQRMKVGTQAPNFSLDDVNGVNINLLQTCYKYKLIVFWESDCSACKQLLQQLKYWYANRNINLEILAISIDADAYIWQQYIKINNLTWINLNEALKWEGETVKAYNVYATPTMFLIDNNNIILAKPNSFEQFIVNLDTVP